MSRKINKAFKKARKAQNLSADTTTEADIRAIAAALHPDNPSIDEKPDEDLEPWDLDDPDFPSSCTIDHRGYAWLSVERWGVDGLPAPPDFDTLVEAALQRLGISSTGKKGSKPDKEQRTLIDKIRHDMMEDLQHAWNEESEIAKRRGGFLRFAVGAPLERVRATRLVRKEDAERRQREAAALAGPAGQGGEEEEEEGE